MSVYLVKAISKCEGLCYPRADIFECESREEAIGKAHNRWKTSSNDLHDICVEEPKLLPERKTYLEYVACEGGSIAFGLLISVTVIFALWFILNLKQLAYCL